MYQTIAITTVTMKRLLNYQRVAEREANAAARLQWRQMTPENMQRFETARKRSERLSAIVVYAGFLFRVQNRLVAYTAFPDEYLLHNELVNLLNELRIPLKMIATEIAEDHTGCLDAER